ncbi:PREDICTED: P protein isoform X2 [Nicrophorus vespilloides]|uniref:P protein isoform X2 n=1 Tax=Nicrophorus vespilloides TaxID=110193 RepID=A0ABM1MN62_NICVS|nr:PREDICTED: P protein isoform X2 [Nicrophorus vespilloides]
MSFVPAMTNQRIQNINEDSGKIFLSSQRRSGRIDTFTPINEEDGSGDAFISNRHLLLSGDYVHESNWKPCLRNVKTVILVIIWIVCSCTLMVKNEKIHVKHHISIPQNSTKGYIINEPIISDKVSISLEGALLPQYYANLSIHNMHVWVQLIKTSYRPTNVSSLKGSDILLVKNVSEVWQVPTVSGKLIGTVPEVVHNKVYKLYDIEDRENYSHYYLKVKLKTNLKTNFPISFSYNVEPINEDHGILYAAGLLILLYILMIFEVIHRTLAAMLVSTMAVATLAALNDRPTMAELVSWIDIETLLLLFSMMTMVAIFTETGIFDYLSVLAFKLTGGKVWPLINTLCFFTALLSCFLDNVTTALLMTPVTIKLCEVMKLNPVPVLINMIVYSNIGGALTPIGDPPNVIIASNAAVIKSGITFSIFTLHMSVGVLLSLLVVHLQLRFMYRDENSLRVKEPEDVQGLKREIAVYQRTAASVSSYSKDEDMIKESLLKRTSRLIGKLKTRNCKMDENPIEKHLDVNIKDLEAQYPIKDKVLLIKCAFTLFFVITVFFMQTIPALSKLGLGWTALLGALLLLILSERDDIEAMLARVEWSTLLFFASLFILMEALSRLGLMDWIGQITHNIVMSVGQESRLTVAILLILWVSAIASAFVDNIPLTTMMIRIATSLADNHELNLPLQPLIWALSFGACLGGNGTLFGSSSNIICAGVAEQHGYRFSFLEFMKVGFPVTISSLIVTTIYLLIAHVFYTWH